MRDAILTRAQEEQHRRATSPDPINLVIADTLTIEPIMRAITEWSTGPITQQPELSENIMNKLFAALMTGMIVGTVVVVFVMGIMSMGGLSG